MPIALREDLLDPIPGPNPAGESLRYAPVYDKIKEARREDDDAPQGEWQRERKVADFNAVLKLAGDALGDKSKDLQLAAWLTEALIAKDGFHGLRTGLDLLRGLLVEFWDGLYPEIEDGDVEMRAAPLDWVGSYLEKVLKKAPFTRSGLGFYKYKESRTVGFEAQADENSTRREAFDQLKAEGKLSADDFDAAIKATPTASYEAWAADLEASLETLDALNDLCQDKFGDVAPSFSRLKSGAEEVQNIVKGILNKRRDAEAPPPQAPLEPEPEYQPEPPQFQERAPDKSTDAAPPGTKPASKPKITGIDPADPAEVALRLAAVAKFLRQNDAYDPAPYLMLRGFRWGETRRQGSSPHASFLIAPTTEARQTIKRLAAESSWGEMLEAAETAMAEPCGRVWMDLQRYVVKALEEWGSPGVSAAIRSELKALIADIPELPTWTFDDDTPVANAETQAWLSGITGPPAAPQQLAAPEPPPYTPPPPSSDAETGEPPDLYELAMEKMRAGRVQEATEMLAQNLALQQSGRARFHSKVQFAQLCLASGRETVALPLLEEMLETIDHHRLEAWEPPETVAHALTLLYRCIEKSGGDAALQQKIYSRICRLDPMQALAFPR